MLILTLTLALLAAPMGMQDAPGGGGGGTGPGGGPSGPGGGPGGPGGVGGMPTGGSLRNANQASAIPPGMSREAFNREMERRMRDQQLRNQRRWAASQSDERKALADRLAGLINDGQCSQALEEANAAGDMNMAYQIRQVCRPNVTVTPPQVQ